MTLAAPLLADRRQEILDFLEALAAALSEGNSSAFLDRVDHSMPDYYQLEQYIDALAGEDEVSCSIDILKQEGDDQSHGPPQTYGSLTEVILSEGAFSVLQHLAQRGLPNIQVSVSLQMVGLYLFM